MHILAKDPAAAALALVAFLTLGCGDSTAPKPAAPTPTGTVVVTVTTTSTGGEIDPDGYLLFLDTEPVGSSVAANGEVTFPAVPGGLHYLYVTGMAAYCYINGGNYIAVEIPKNKATSLVPISIVVICSAPPPGGDPDPWGY
jgi:hypothetical protein